MRTRLLAYTVSLLASPGDWRHAARLADRAQALAAATPSVGADPESGLPHALAAAVRAVVRDHLTPDPGPDAPPAAAPVRVALAA
ncbi:hypothetical protein [Streptomyces chumphonensis]|uniref:hypothetical protein n=1 Tax=Streptomyces chumphonensis TaxID=1214925 RepID=UPI003D737EDF